MRSLLTEPIGPEGVRRLLATLAIATSLSGACFGILHFTDEPSLTSSMILGAGLLFVAGCAAFRSRSPAEGSTEEVEKLRRVGRRIVRCARLGSVILLLSGTTMCGLVFVPSGAFSIVAVWVLSLLLGIHLFGRIYPSFDPPAPERWVESLPAAETPVPEPDPSLARLQQQKEELRSRNYR